MNRVLLPLLALLLLASLALPNRAHAYIITVNFTVLGDPADPLHGSDLSSGSFSFDSSLIPSTLPGTVFNSVNGLDATSLNFTWAGHTYSTADADVYRLAFDSSGNLAQWGIAGTVNGLGNISPGVDDFDMTSTNWVYTYPGTGEVFGRSGTNLAVAWSVTTSENAPEPGSLALVAPALLAFGLIRRRRR